MKERSVWVSRVLVIILGAAAAVAGIFVFVRDRDSGSGELHIRNSYLVMTEDGKLEVRSGSNGRMLRLLRDDLVIGAERHGIEVTDDGRYAFHDAAVVDCDGTDLQAIERVDLVRGVNQLVGVGSSPVLSDEDRRLSFFAKARDGRPIARVERGRWECDRDLVTEDSVVVQVDLRSNDVSYAERSLLRMDTAPPEVLGDDVVAAARLA